MTKEELEKRLESVKKQMIGLQDEIQNLEAKLAEAQDEPEIPDFPVFKSGGEDSWHMDSCLNVSSQEYAYGKTDDYNFFHTREYAQEFAKKCKLIAMMLHCKWYLDREYEPDWSKEAAQKWFVCFNYHSGEFVTDYEFSVIRGQVYFSSEKTAQKCAEWMNKHWRDSE